MSCPGYSWIYKTKLDLDVGFTHLALGMLSTVFFFQHILKLPYLSYLCPSPWIQIENFRMGQFFFLSPLYYDIRHKIPSLRPLTKKRATFLRGASFVRFIHHYDVTFTLFFWYLFANWSMNHSSSSLLLQNFITFFGYHTSSFLQILKLLLSWLLLKLQNYLTLFFSL